MADGSPPLLQVLALSRRARHAASAPELAFLLVNDTRALLPYRQAALWFDPGGLQALSGVVEPEANAPYAQWLQRLFRFLQASFGEAAAITAVQLPAELAQEWNDWLPPHGLWLPMGVAGARGDAGGLLLAADTPWSEDGIALAREWVDTWHHAWTARRLASAGPWHGLLRWLGRRAPADRPWWKRRRVQAALAAAGVLCLPVRLSVLAPGELVPAHPALIRAPVDGVIGQFHVEPNQVVQAGQALFSFDEASVAAHQEMTAQALATAQAEYRQQAQQAVSDARSKPQLAVLLGKIEERRAEADFFRSQLERSRVTAPVGGVALFDDPTEWIGKPVQTGERILRIAAPGDVEVEAWLPIGDAIPLAEGAPLRLYLASDPLAAIAAKVRYVAHDAVARPDGSYAYRVRARLEASAAQRVGLKGTAKISGDRVPLAYWMLRRPWAMVRQAVGW